MTQILIEQKGVVSMQHYPQPLKVNESYQTPGRVKSYVITQEYVVPKDILFKKIVDIVVSEFGNEKESIKVLEPGMGPAAFSRYCVKKDFVTHFEKVSICGGDISKSMVEYASDLLNDLSVEEGVTGRVDVRLSSGVNCVDLGSDFYTDEHNQAFDVIVASQFEHYCPNLRDSDLANRLIADNVSFSTKGEFRRYCHSLLADGGIYFTIDDRLGETPEEHKEICLAWDKHIVNQFTDETVLAQLSELNPALARNLRINYAPSRTFEELVHVAAQAREHRRDICSEEIETFSQTRQDFAQIFGEDNVEFLKHPSTGTHPGFYLIWGIKKNK